MPKQHLLTRRRLLELGLSAGALAALPLGCSLPGGDHSAELLAFVSDSDLPVRPDEAGVLTVEEFDKLCSLCRYADRVWELDADIPAYLPVLQADLELKTSLQPSYLTEYRNALGLLDLLTPSVGDDDELWTHLLFVDLGADSDPARPFHGTKLGRARSFVFAEILEHQIPLSGGFKSFGLMNYRGYFGGPYTYAKSYRRGTV